MLGESWSLALGFTMEADSPCAPHLGHCGAAADNWADMWAMEAEVRDGVMVWGQVCGGGDVHLPWTAYRLSRKLVGLYGSDSWGNGLIQAALNNYVFLL